MVRVRSAQWAALAIALLAGCGLLVAPTASADPAPTVTALFERNATTSVYRDTTQPNTSVVAGRETLTDAAQTRAVTFRSQTGSDPGPSVEIDVAADLQPGTYTTSRAPGGSSTYLEVGSILSCGTEEPGTLTVRSAAYDADGTPTEYDASFDVSCDGGAPVHGEIRYASDQALAVATAPAVSAVPGKVVVGSTADDSVVVTAGGNAPATLGAVTLADVGHDSTGTPYFTIGSDGCSNRTLAAGASCTVTLHVAPLRPNGYPASTQYAAVVVPDGQLDPLRALAQASIAPMPGQPVGLTATPQFRQIVLQWGAPQAAAADWTPNPTYLYYDVFRVDGSTRTLVGSTRQFAPYNVRYAVAGLPDHYSGTFVVESHEAATSDGPDSLPASASTVHSELLLPESGGVVVHPLDPAGPDSAFGPMSPDFATATGNLAVSRDQSKLAFTFTYPGEGLPRVGVGRVDGADQDFASEPKAVKGVFDTSPAVSPDGSQVVYEHTDTTSGVSTLQIVGAVAQPRTVPNSTGLVAAVFGKDGRTIVADHGVGADAVLVSLDPATGKQTVLAGGAGLVEPDVGADGRIVAVRGSGLVLLSPAGAVTPIVGATDGSNTRPHFSANGGTVYYTHSDDPSGSGGHSASVDLATGAVTLYTSGSETSGTPFVLHEDAPDVAAPAVTVVAPSAPSDLGSTVAVSWSATDPTVIGHTTSGLGTVDLRYRTAVDGGSFGGYVYPAAWTRITTFTEHLATRAGTEYCFSARARDGAGNVSAWTAERCTATPVDDRSLSTRAARLKGAAYYGGTVSRAAAAGATFARTHVTASRVGLLVTTCRTCGSVDVWLGAHKLGRVSTKASATHNKQLTWLPTHLYGGTLILRTVDRSQVLLDGVLLLR